MPLFLPHGSVAALLAGPAVWLGYFVASYLVAAFGCRLGAGDAAVRAALGVVAAIGLALIVLATLQTYRHWRELERGPKGEAHEQRSFVAHATLFLCGIALLGILWGGLNLVFFDSCQ